MKTIEMKPSRILRLAARWLESDPDGDMFGTCHAVSEVTDRRINGYDHRVEPMKTMRRLYGRPVGRLWWQYHNDRIIGVCLAAAVLRSEGL